MRTVRQHKCILMYAVLATVAMLVVGPGWAIAASNQDNQYQNQQQSQDQGNPSYQAPSRSSQSQGRDMRLEQQIASQLRQQGYGTRGEIMILATANRVILLGTVPDNRTKDGAEKVAKQIATRQSIDNRLHVNAQAKRLPDAELEKDTYDKLGDNLSQNVQVRAQNGAVTLQGQLDNWRQVADAIDAAFAAGATQVNSQFSVAGAGAMAQGGAQGYGGGYQAYGYAPGQQGQPSYAPRGRTGAMGGRETATNADLQLARQVANQLRQQLPPGQNVQPVPPQSIYVTVQQGTVTLHGYVQNSNQKQQAEQIAQSISGVQNVQNDLAILSTRGTAGQGGGQMGTQQGYGAPSSQGGYQQSYGGTSGQSSSQQGFGGMSGTSSSDRRLAQNVQQQIQNQLPDANINVSASQGTVTLRGTVQDDNAKQQAAQIAQSVNGVQNVQNNLRVSSQGGAFQPQGYIPGQSSSQSQQGMSSQDQSSSQSSSQQGMAGGMAGQNQYGQSSQSQQGMSGQDQSSSQSSQQGLGGSQGQYSQGGQSQFGQGAPMGGSQAGMSSSDMALAQKVVQQLKQKLTGIQNIRIMRPGTIYVMAAQGTVMLHGSVSNQNISQQATRIARAIPGVRNIESTLQVSGAGGQAFGYVPGQSSQGQQGAAGQGMAGQNQGAMGRNQGMTGRNQGMAGQNQGTQGSAQMQYIGNSNANQSAQNQGMYGQNQGMYGQGQSTAGQMGTGPSGQSDMALAQQVAQRLRQQVSGVQNVQVAQPGTIYVIVNKGTVTLDGFVSNNTLKQKAEQVAKSISGVKGVKNSLTISAGATGGQSYGYMPPGQDQGANAQFMEDQYANQQLGNQSGNQQAGNQFGNRQFGNQMGNQQAGDQSGNQAFGFIPPDEDQSDAQQFGNEQAGNMSAGNQQFGNQMGNQQSDEDQAGDEQPDEGTY